MKIIILFVFSISIYASELTGEVTKQQIASDINPELRNTELLDALSSLSASIDTLVQSTEGLSNAPKVDKELSNKHIELHNLVLETSNNINQAISQGLIRPTLVEDVTDDSLVLKERVDNLYDDKSYFSYADLAAIAITSVAVLVTIVGIAIALLSFWGYRSIKATTKASARSVAETVAAETTEQKIDIVVKDKLIELIDEGKFTHHLEKIVDAFILRGKEGSKNVNWDELDRGIDWDSISAEIDRVPKEGDDK